MSGVDPLELLGRLDGPIQPRPAFADALLEQCLDALEPRHWSLPRSRAVRVVAVLAACLVLAAAATATYLALRGSAATTPRPAELTVIAVRGGRITGAHPDLAAIQAVGGDGRLRTVWQCPEHTWCGDATSMAWSPGGRRLALTLGEIGGRSGYVGLHVIDVATGVDHHLGVPPIPHVAREQPTSVLERLGRAATRALGCILPHQVAWAPDGKRLAYVCGDDLQQGGIATTLHLINADGTGQRRIRTGTRTAYWPSFSPDGSRVAFATEPRPRVTYRHDTEIPAQHFVSSVYTVRLDGSERKLVAHSASAPAWSPDGTTIAYETTCGIRLSTPIGTVADACLVPGGRPAWSPDGLRLAVVDDRGVSIVDADGTGLRHLTGNSSAGTLGVGRPAWRPRTVAPRVQDRRPDPGL